MEGTVPTPKQVENKYWERYVRKGDVQTALERVFAQTCENPIDRYTQYVNVGFVTDEAVVVAKERGVRDPLFYNMIERGGKRVQPIEYVHHQVLRCKLPGWKILRHLNEWTIRVVPAGEDRGFRITFEDPK